MTVLRSRKVLPIVAPPKPSPPLVPVKAAAEPVTPSKTSEFLNSLSYSGSPSVSLSTQNGGSPEIGFGSGDGSIIVSECGTVRRHSARLAKKVGISEYRERVEVVSAKRKRAVVEVLKGKELGLEDREEDEVETVFLNLRSGRRVEKRIIRDSSGVASNLIEGIENDEVNGGVLNVDVLSESMAKAIIEGTENVNGKEESPVVSEGKVCSETSLINDFAPTEFMLHDRALTPGKTANLKEAVKDKGGIVIESGAKTRRLSKEEKGKMKSGVTPSLGDLNQDAITSIKGKGGIVIETREKTRRKLSIEERGKIKMEIEVESEIGGSVSGADNTPIDEPSKVLIKGKGGIVIETREKTRRRLSIEEKGKAKMEIEVESETGGSVSGVDNTPIDEALPDRVQVRDTDMTGDITRSAYRERFRRIARRNASRFAHFSLHEELDSRAHDATESENSLPKLDGGIEDWPGPFSTAMKIIKDRGGNRDGERRNISTNVSEAVELQWIPKNQESCKNKKQVPSLINLCLSVLSENADAITSLDFVPDALRHKICWFLCNNRKMDCHFLELLVRGTPTEILVRDCSWLSEELFSKTFKGCNTNKLTVLQFDQCGSCMPDCTLYATLANSYNSLPALSTVSLKGAYRLSDAGLRMLISAAPSLKSIDISQCPLITSEGICCVANTLTLVLREFYLDYCDGVDAMLILPALQKLEHLEVLSVAGILTVCDDFVSGFISVNGCRMKELVLADCMELTNSSLKVIGDACPDLRSIDLTNLSKLTDISIGFLANGCREIQALKLCRNAFSDEAIAAYLDVRGASLNDLALNNVIQVSNHTALSLARNCRSLRSLDLSWCRNLKNEALGLIVDSCVLLEVLKLFGCSQVTSVLIDGHSNPRVSFVGLKMTEVLKEIDAPDFLIGPLRYP